MRPWARLSLLEDLHLPPASVARRLRAQRLDYGRPATRDLLPGVLQGGPAALEDTDAPTRIAARWGFPSRARAMDHPRRSAADLSNAADPQSEHHRNTRPGAGFAQSRRGARAVADLGAMNACRGTKCPLISLHKETFLCTGHAKKRHDVTLVLPYTPARVTVSLHSLHTQQSARAVAADPQIAAAHRDTARVVRLRDEVRQNFSALPVELVHAF